MMTGWFIPLMDKGVGGK